MTPSAAATATWSAAGDGESLWFLGTLATIRVPGQAVDDRYALLEFLFPHGASPPLHTHPQDESYVVLEGRLTIQAATIGSSSPPAGSRRCRPVCRTPSGSTAIRRGCSFSARPRGSSEWFGTGRSRQLRGCFRPRGRRGPHQKNSTGYSALTARSTSAHRSRERQRSRLGRGARAAVDSAQPPRRPDEPTCLGTTARRLPDVQPLRRPPGWAIRIAFASVRGCS